MLGRLGLFASRGNYVLGVWVDLGLIHGSLFAQPQTWSAFSWGRGAALLFFQGGQGPALTLLRVPPHPPLLLKRLGLEVCSWML